ncbi:MAG: chitinase [Fibrobacteres bacterium]|nr:chitinase [Fibrobacterota bacterium]
MAFFEYLGDAMKWTSRTGFTRVVAAAGVLLPAFLMPAEAKPKLPVFGFYTSWAPPSVRYDKITHLMYAFLNPGGGGQITGSVPGDVISTAHGAGVKVIASIGGANNSSGFPTLAASASGRSAFAGACKAIVDAGADGVDIDWEFPANATDSTNFTLLLKAIRASIGASKLITLELAPTDEKGRWVPKGSVDIADFYTAMAFDFTGDFPGSVVGQHSTYQQGVLGINYWWRNRGVRKDKVVMGVPFYGKNFNAGGSAVDYKDIVNANPGLAAAADSVGKTWFNGPVTIKKKATYVAEQAYGGVMIWQLGGDTSPGAKSLLDAIEQGLAAPAVRITAREGGKNPSGGSGSPALAWIASQGSPENGTSVRLRAVDGRLSATYGTSGANRSMPAAGIYLIEPGRN